VDFVEADILDGRSLGKAMRDVDVVVHLAAQVQVPLRDGEAHAFDQVNNWGSAQVAAAIEDEPTVRHALYLSSATIYGSSDTTITTDTPPEPNTVYGVTKLRGEAHFRRLARPDRSVHIVRAGNVYGLNPAARFDAIVNRFLLDGRFKRRLRILGSGEQTRSFVEVGRLASAITALVTSDVPSSTMNLTDETRSVLEVAELVQGFDPGVELLFVDQDMRMQRVDVAASSEIIELIGPAVALETTLRQSWDCLAI
jgi:UDP-glucose 4-epimerase